jgi:hypothetical protein
MHMPTAIHTALPQHVPLSTLISTHENQSGWKKCKLASAEVTGLTMDSYAVGCAYPELNAIDTLLRQLPYQHGFSTDSWQIVTDIEIAPSN